MKDSKIEWCDDTVNLWWGCTEVHEGCDNCYARVLSNRWGKELWGDIAPRELKPKAFNLLSNLQAKAKADGAIRRVFIGSMMDIFEKEHLLHDSKGEPIKGISTNGVRQKLFQNISDGLYPNLVFLLLTKRPSNINKYIPAEWLINPPANVMYGATAVNQQTFNDVMRAFAKVKGKKFLSVEPQLERIVLPDGFNGVDWIIQGGESGHHKRPFDIDWAYAMSVQCGLFKVPYFFKQIDKIQPIPDDLLIRQFPVL